jgi:hypothetical protein
MSDAEYLIKREQQELEAALRTSDARVRQVHLELAAAYTFRLNQTKRLERRTKRTPMAEARR